MANSLSKRLTNWWRDQWLYGGWIGLDLREQVADQARPEAPRSAAVLLPPGEALRDEVAEERERPAA